MILFIFLGALSFASSNINPEFLKDFKKIEDQITLSSKGECRLSQDANYCSLSKVCDMFKGKEDRKYTYQNSLGERLENLELNQYREAAIRCLGSVDQDLDMGPLYSITTVNLTFDPRSSEYERKFEQQEKRATELFEKTKRQAIEYLNQRIKKHPNRSNQLKNLIQRIETIQFEALRYRKNGYSGDCDIPNAYFLPQQVSIQVCPQLLSLPEGALMGLFAHELGHAVDPCNMSMNYFKFESGQYEVSLDDDYLEQDESKKGMLELAIPSLKVSEYPFNSVIQCLQSKASAGIEPPSQKRHLSINAKKLEESDLTQEDREFLMQKRRADINYFKKNPYCQTFSDSNHTQESFSDWFAAEVMAQTIDQTQSLTRKKEIALEADFVKFGYSCEGRVQKIKNIFLLGSLKDKLNNCDSFNPSYDFDESDTIVHRHPETKIRYERILLAQPTIRKALNCPANQQPKHCQ